MIQLTQMTQYHFNKGKLNMEISEKASDWFIFGEHGASSLTMFGRFFNIPIERSHPSDPADFRRCMLLLKQVPELKSRLKEMADVSPTWAVLVEHWNEIASMLRREIPNWEEKYATGSAPETYRLMRKIIHEGIPNKKENWKDYNIKASSKDYENYTEELMKDKTI